MEAFSATEVSIPISFDEQIKELAAWAEPQHSDKAEFHHFPHSLGVYETAMLLADRFETKGYNINRRALGFAAIGHDIHAHQSLDFQPVNGQDFKSKEHRSAWLTREFLLTRGYDLDTVAQPAYDLIVTTKQGEPVNTTEDIIIRMADIFNTSQMFEEFEERAQAFYRETCYFENKNCSFQEWLPGAMNFLEGFLHPNMPKDFVDKAKENIQRIRDKYLTDSTAA